VTKPLFYFFNYRATLCISAVFIAVGRCPSVRLSVTFLYPDGWRYRQNSLSTR